MMRANPYITVYQNNKPIVVTPELFQTYRTLIIDSLHRYLKYVYNHAKEKFTTQETQKINMGNITLETNLKGGLTFSPNGEVTFSDPNFKKAIEQLINDTCSLMLTYHRAEDFLSIMQTPEMWALLIFVGADQNLTDLLIAAEKEYFNAVYANSKNTKEVATRKSIIAIVDALRAGRPIDLSTLTFYDQNGNKVNASGTIYPCEK
jgi:hypothetical protein